MGRNSIVESRGKNINETLASKNISRETCIQQKPRVNISLLTFSLNKIHMTPYIPTQDAQQESREQRGHYRTHYNNPATKNLLRQFVIVECPVNIKIVNNSNHHQPSAQKHCRWRLPTHGNQWSCCTRRIRNEKRHKEWYEKRTWTQRIKQIWNWSGILWHRDTRPYCVATKHWSRHA